MNPPLVATMAAVLAVGTVGVTTAVGRRRARRRLRLGERGRGALVVPCPRRFSRVLDDLDLPIDPHRAWVGAVSAAMLAAAVGLVVAGWPATVAAFVLLAGAASAGVRLRRHHVARRFDHDLLAALDAIAGSLRAGATLVHAVADAAARVDGRLGADLAALVGSIGAGVPFAAAVDAWAVRRPADSVRMTAAALGLAAGAGGAAAPTVEGVAGTLRDRQHARADASVMASQARASMVVLLLAPIGFAVFLAGLDGDMVHFLVATPIGLGCLLGGIVLDALGAWWMTHLVRRAL